MHKHKRKPEITPILKWFGQMTYIHLRGPLRWGSHLPLANLLKGKDKYPSYNLLQMVHTLTNFWRERRRWTLKQLKIRLAKDFSKTFISIYCFLKGCILSWELRGIYRPQEDSNLGSKFWILLGFRGWRCHRPTSRVLGGATAWLSDFTGLA